MRLRPILRPIISSPLHGLFGPTLAPEGAILHYDADIDAFSELTGGPHTFNHAVLSPQYQLGADGSYTDVGAKPAVDTFDGEKWLRSCGAVTNLQPRSEDFSTRDRKTNIIISANTHIAPDGNQTADTATATIANAHTFVRNTFQAEYNQFYNYSIYVNKSSTWRYIGLRCLSFTNKHLVYDMVNNTFGAPPSDELISCGAEDCGNYIKLSLSAKPIIQQSEIDNGYTTTGPRYFGFCFASSSGEEYVDITQETTIIVWGEQLTKTAYPQPYVPTNAAGPVTQPASNATTTNGMWFSLPDGSPLWKALTGEPLTLATRVRMGLAGSDYPRDLWAPILAEKESGAYHVQDMSFGADAGEDRVVRASCSESSTVIMDATWPRNAIILRVTQVSADGTQFRVGYMIEGTHTEIQWSVWVAYDGSFDPSTLYRLMLGFNNKYPMWFNKITAWKKQATDAEILEAMAA